MRSMDKRAEAVMRAINDVRNIMEDRDHLNAITTYLLQTDPQFVLETIRSGKKNS